MTVPSSKAFVISMGLLLALAGACGDDDDVTPTPDSGPADSGGGGDTDAGDTDAGGGDTDAGSGDSDAGGGDTDAGGGDTDAGGGDTDAGMVMEDGGMGMGGVDAGPVRGCADGMPMCPEGQMCCSGVPYPAEGICMPDCPAVSDRAQKHDIRRVDPDAMLARLSSLPIAEWSYDFEGGVRHVGPMAQDFRASFGLGADDRTIHPVDAAGVTMAAVQALHRQVEELRAEQRELARENDRLRAQVRALEAR